MTRTGVQDAWDGVDAGRARSPRPVSLRRARRPGRTRDAQPRDWWWDRPDMRAALAGHDLATVLRLLQHRHGMSQRAIGERTGTSQGQIAEILAGRRVRSYQVLARFALGLGIPAHHLGLHLADNTGGVPRQQTRDQHPREPVAVPTDQPAPAGPRPATLPARWWDEPVHAVALAGQDFARVLTYLTRRGVTADEIAQATGLSAAQVEAVAAGHSTLDSYRAMATMCDWLGIPRGRAGLAHTHHGTDPRAAPRVPHRWTATHVSALRAALRATPGDLAHILGIEERTVTIWERDQRTPGRDSQLLLDVLLHSLDTDHRAIYDDALLHEPPDPAANGCSRPADQTPAPRNAHRRRP